MINFTPNWVKMGLESKENAWKYIIGCLIENKKKITSKSLNNEASFILGDNIFVIKGNAKKKGKEKYSMGTRSEET